MPYTFKNTERNNAKASSYETKFLLYLIGTSRFKKDIEYVAFDCFNDVSGIDKAGCKIWDIQSKNEKSINPKKIGKYFFTLFDNFISDFSFKEYIFYCPQINSKYKIKSALREYCCANFETKTFNRIEQGLREEVARVKGISIDYSSKIDSFLKKIIIVEDNKTEQEYIKSIIKFKKKELRSDEFYLSVFKDIQNTQTAKKIHI